MNEIGVYFRYRLAYGFPLLSEREVNFICFPGRRGNAINYKKGWKYVIGVDLFKMRADTFDDYFFQGYHLYVYFTVNIVSNI